VSKFPIVLLYRNVTNLIHAYAAELVAREPRNNDQYGFCDLNYITTTTTTCSVLQRISASVQSQKFTRNCSRATGVDPSILCGATTIDYHLLQYNGSQRNRACPKIVSRSKFELRASEPLSKG
jgi:hypothetical protein